MGLFADILKRFNKQNEESQFEKQDVKPEEQKEQFISDISMFEFENVDWSDFGRILKQNRILPNSYLKKPAEVEVKTSKKGQPMVILTFNSSTSNSVRKYMLLQNGAFEYINGAIDDGKNPDLLAVWNNFKNEIRYLNYLNTNREEGFQKRAAERTIEAAERTKRILEDLYKKEQMFIERYKDTKFDEFCYSAMFEKDNKGFTHYTGEMPKFIPLVKTEDGHYISGEPVIPFTPKTLEFCILHMTNGQKIEDGEYPDDFEEKCRKIQAFSGYESEDWDKVIKIGKNIVKNQYKASIVTGNYEREL